MKTLLKVVCFSTIGLVLANPDVPTAFKSAKLVPEIVTEAPEKIVEVEYGEKRVELGNELTLTETTNMPVVYYKYKCGARYTMMMIDPDVPGLPRNHEFVHWLVVNILEDEISEGEVLAEYVKPTPPAGSGLHRYTFLVYKQNQGAIKFHEKFLSAGDTASRKNFSTHDFTEKYDLGYPVRGNFFRAQAQSSSESR